MSEKTLCDYYGNVMPEITDRIKLLQTLGCVSCGMPCKSKKLRPSSDGGYELFCRDCIEEGKAISKMTKAEREEYGIDC